MRSRNSRQMPWVLFLFASIMTFVGLKLNVAPAGPMIPVSVVEFGSVETKKPTMPKMINSLALEDVVNRSLIGANGHYAVAVRNLRTNESYFVNEHEVFPSASLYKLWVMATVYDALREGKLSNDQVLSDSIPQLNRKFQIDDESAELTSGNITISVKNALEQMIGISHNYAAMLLTDTVGIASVSAKMKQIGLTESRVGSPPVTTASDVELFFEQLYRFKISDPQNSKLMIELLSRQQKNLGIPRYLPNGIMVAHKTGEIAEYKHNGGIISTPKNDYVFVVMSKSNFPEGAQERIALISKAVFDYFENK